MEDSILVQGLCKKFDGFALKDVSFRVPQGRIVGFIGENGAGKSTTIRLILNQLKKDSGQIRLLGQDHTQPEVRAEIGVAFDSCNFHEVFTALDVERMLSSLYPHWDKTLYRQYLRRFSIPEKQKIGSFSKGMKMKLSIVSAMAHRPKLLILDESTTGLDPVVRDEILDLFLEFIQEEDRSIFFSSHITSDIEKIADYVVLIHQGRIVFDEEKDNLLYRYGILKCGKERFSALDVKDYLVHRSTKVCEECLVRDKEAIGRKYRELVVDNAGLEDIMLFYAKGESSWAD